MKKYKNYAWCLGVCVSVVGVVVALGNAFGFKVNEVAITSVITAILGVFVSMGIIVKDDNSPKEEKNTLKEEDFDEEIFNLEENSENAQRPVFAEEISADDNADN